LGLGAEILADSSGIFLIVNVHIIAAALLSLSHLDLALLASADGIGAADSSEIGVDAATTLGSAAHFGVCGLVIAKEETAIGVELGGVLLLGARAGVQEAQAGLGGGDVGQGVRSEQIQRVIFGRHLADVLGTLSRLLLALDASLSFGVNVNNAGVVVVVVRIGEVRAVHSLVKGVARLLLTLGLVFFLLFIVIGSTLLLLALVTLTLLANVHNKLAVLLANKVLHKRSTEAADQTVDDTLDLTAQTTLVLLVPSHQVGDKSRQARTQSVIGENDNGDLDEAKDGADNLAVVAGEEELDSLNKIREDLRTQVLVELKEETGQSSDGRSYHVRR
jgi:hypothetical protein